jgi:endonuclease/exonuclease/phosphatase (EEP) superfamily protein YafD
VALCALPGSVGMRHWLIDNGSSFALQMLVVAVALTALSVVRRRVWSAAAGVVAAGALALQVLPHVAAGTARADGQTLSWLVASVRVDNTSHAALVDLIQDRRPHIVGLVETDARWLRVLDRPLREYPHRVQVSRPDAFGMALYSRLPLTGARERELGAVPTISASLSVAQHAIDLVLVHALPPLSPDYARRRDQQLRQLAALRPKPGGSLVLAGDFNVTPYSPSFGASFASAFTRAPGLGGTFPASFPAPLRIPIDHAFAAGPVSLRRVIERDIASDHLPFTVYISIPSGPRMEP